MLDKLKEAREIALKQREEAYQTYLRADGALILIESLLREAQPPDNKEEE